MFSIANQVPIALDSYLPLFEKSAYYNSYKICKIISTIGKSLKIKAEYCVNLLIKRLDNNNNNNSTENSIAILKEIYSIAQVHSSVLDTCLIPIYEQCKNSPANIKHMIDQLSRLQSSSVLNEHSSYGTLLSHSLDSIENSPTKTKYILSRSQSEESSAETLSKSSSTRYFHRESSTKSEILNSTLKESQRSHTLSNSLDFRFDKSLTIHEDDEENAEQDKKRDDDDDERINQNQVESLTDNQEVNQENIDEIISSIDKCIDEEEKKDKVKELVTLREKEEILSVAETRLSTRCSDYVSLDRDVVRQFCDKHMDKICAYINSLFPSLPLPIDCWIDDHYDNNKLKPKRAKYLNLNFSCYLKGQYCLFDKNYFEIRSTQVSIWIHLIFLSLQSKWSYPLTQRDQPVIDLKKCYQSFKESDKLGFVPLITSSFPIDKEQKLILNELKDLRFFDLFQFNKEHKQWFCYLCSNPDKARDLSTQSTLIQGQLKEKRGKWKLFKRWKKRLYTLTGGNIVYMKKDMVRF